MRAHSFNTDNKLTLTMSKFLLLFLKNEKNIKLNKNFIHRNHAIIFFFFVIFIFC